MASCTYNPNIDSYNPYAVLTLTEDSQSVDNNLTNVKYSLDLYRPSEIQSSASKDYKVIVNGTTVKSGTTTIGGSGKKTIASGTVQIKHDSDGTKSIAFNFSLDFEITWSGTYVGTGTASGKMDLTDIPRATTPTFSANPVEMGKAVTIKMARASSNFTHTLEYKIGSASGTLTTGAGVSYEWTVPIDLANQVAGATSGICVITCKTYNTGNILIGTKTANLKLSVPDSIIPSITAVNITENVEGVAEKFNQFLQNISKLSVKTTAAGSYGSTIQSYSVKVQGVLYNGANVITNVLTSSGEVVISVTVKDSRGRSTTLDETISVTAYTSPTISKLSIVRSDSDGVEKNTGTYALSTLKFSISSINSLNDKSYLLEYRKSDEEEWTSIQSGAVYSMNQSVLSGEILDTAYSYIIRLTIKDYFTSVNAEVPIGRSKPLYNARKDKKGFAFFKMSEKEGFEVGDLAYFYEPVKEDKGSYAHHTVGTSGEAGYVNIARFTISEAYQNSPICVHVIQRGTKRNLITIRFANVNGTDPDIGVFTHQDKEVYLVKSDTSAWDLYVLKTEKYDHICVIQIDKSRHLSGVEIEWKEDQVAALPDGYITSENENLQKFVINTKSYSVTLTANDYVSPYTYYSSIAISEDDIAAYGEPISVSATGSGGVPVPTSMEADRRSYKVVAKASAVTVRITFLKIG